MLLLASRGTPMLSMGSELGFSQGGNNNAYAQDNATSAIDWARRRRFADRLHRAPDRGSPRQSRAVARRLPDRRRRSTRPVSPTSNGATRMGR